MSVMFYVPPPSLASSTFRIREIICEISLSDMICQLCEIWSSLLMIKQVNLVNSRFHLSSDYRYYNVRLDIN